MLDPAATAFINHLLRGASWARDELKRFSGRTARFEVAPFALLLTVLDNGEVALADAGAVPAVTARLTPGLMLRLAARDSAAWQDVDIAGDTDFASAIHHVARNLRWDIEEDMSRVFGDIPAHRMAEAGRTLRRWGDQAFENTGRSFAEYWTEEQPLIAGRRDVDEFNRAVDALRDDVARLEKRIEYLSNRQDAKRAKY
jgi:ubiquinone biosynthesis accessory factor UbiJ